MNINYEFETIAAIATPLAAGGVGVIRISGADAFSVAQKVFSKEIQEPGKIHHGWILDGEIKIDEVVLLPFKAPRSYTGEDVVEIQCHGGIKVVQKILSLVLQNGARIAQRGEFTKRAFLNHKMDLSQAESVLDLIQARTENFVQKSANNLSGALAAEIGNIRGIIFNLLSRIVAAIDFPEDVAEPDYSFLRNEIETCIDKIEKILSSARTSNILRQGIKIAIAGCPNAGKSSLFNALLNLDRAIVTDIPGTTRDVIQETIDINGIPATLIDTAGIREREGLDRVEIIGIDYTKKYVENADLVLFLYDSNTGFTDEDEKIYELIKNKPHIKIAAKADLNKIPAEFSISSKTGENIDILKDKITKIVIDKNSVETEFITNQRQQDCLQKALESLKIALAAVEASELQDLISIDIKSALMSLDEITGEVITDDILNNIFENFCIGK